jgi:hypothetical protein
MKWQAALLVVAATCIAACGSSSKQQEEKKVMPVQDTVFGGTVSALDKAKAVEGTLEKQKQDRDAAIEAAEKPDDAK